MQCLLVFLNGGDGKYPCELGKVSREENAKPRVSSQNIGTRGRYI